MRKNKAFYEEPAQEAPATFFERVYDVIARIPYGKVVSYGQIARLLGNPRAARQVGWACAVCPAQLPWQRVVTVDGAVTGGAYADMRRALLESEGVAFLPDGRVDMDACRTPDALLAASRGGAAVWC
ncbi:MAG: MGMT family protein [Clostridiales Family XIII bacterium]|jgi:methylated-DNA-protein-cysteine methyltransferase-like protein|nr:MGMT family protein [Clostridiales Family XIII bacterium]